jgi:hypothetical protein
VYQALFPVKLSQGNFKAFLKKILWLHVAQNIAANVSKHAV